MMTTGDICALPVRQIAAPDCALLLWAVHSHLPDALAVVRAWGFAYKTVAFTWVKRTPKDTGFFLSRGYWTHSNAEVCLLATRGKAPACGHGGAQPSGLPSPGTLAQARRSTGADRADLRGRASGGVVRPGESGRLERLGDEVECEFSLKKSDFSLKTG